MTEEKSPREMLHEAIQRSADTSTDLEGAVLVGWIAVCEWMDGDGVRWLSDLESSDGGDSGLTQWQRQGYLFNALHNEDGFENDPKEDEEGET